jgi:hypothetical protein
MAGCPIDEDEELILQNSSNSHLLRRDNNFENYTLIEPIYEIKDIKS